MRLVVQRVSEARVEIEGRITGAIRQGLLVLVGIHRDDQPDAVSWCVNKLVHLRIFSDEQGKMNRSVRDINGQILIISQFTLYGNCAGGRRPDFLQAAPQTTAIPLYEAFIEQTKKQGLEVQTGEFGAYMHIYSINDGPVTLVIDS